jgi:hypothetical protein
MIFIYVFFLFMLAAIFLFYLTYKRLHFKYSSSNDLINAGLYGHVSPSTSCIAANSLTSCATTDDCKKCSDYKKDHLVCRPYLNATKACASMDKCDETFCDITYNKKTNQRECKPRSFCQMPEPIEVCNERNGGEFHLTGVSEGGPGSSGAEQVFQCMCKYPQIAAGDGCELNPGVCEGGDWIYHAKDECTDQVDETNCLYRGQLTPTDAKNNNIPNFKQLPPSAISLRKSCQWFPSSIDPSQGVCTNRAPDPTKDCICPPTSYLLIKDQGAMGKQEVPICVPKNKNTCANEKMCTNFYSNVMFPVIAPSPGNPGQNYKSSLDPVPYLLPRRPPTQFVWSPAACQQPANFVVKQMTGLGNTNAVAGTPSSISPSLRRHGGIAKTGSPSLSKLANECGKNLGTCNVAYGPEATAAGGFADIISPEGAKCADGSDCGLKPGYVPLVSPAGIHNHVPGGCPSTNFAFGSLCDLTLTASSPPSDFSLGYPLLASSFDSYDPAGTHTLISGIQTRSACEDLSRNGETVFQTVFAPDWKGPPGV